MMEEGHKDIFLSCFKCGRIVRSSDSECPRCGLQFGPGTLFECPFCCGLIWRNATVCSTCGIDLAKFSSNVEKSSEGFDMDEFVDNIITNELRDMKTSVRRVACPGCGLMIRGDEDRCPRCDLPLEEAQVDCPVCGEKLPLSAKSCTNCQAMLAEPPEEGEMRPPEQEAVDEILGVAKPERAAKAKPAKKAEPPKKKPEKKPAKKPEKKAKPKK
jgi:RNA polymerase subunit RPABC4/transcription elongation factor Spt4